MTPEFKRATARRLLELQENLTPTQQAGVNAALAAAIRFAEARDLGLSIEEQYLVVETAVAAVRAAELVRL